MRRNSLKARHMYWLLDEVEHFSNIKFLWLDRLNICASSTNWKTTSLNCYVLWYILCSICRNHNSVLSTFIIFQRNYNIARATGGAGTAYPSRAPDLTTALCGIRIWWSFLFCVGFCGLFCFYHLFSCCRCIVCPSSTYDIWQGLY
jgi:hypothetical protein